MDEKDNTVDHEPGSLISIHWIDCAQEIGLVLINVDENGWIKILTSNGKTRYAVKEIVHKL